MSRSKLGTIDGEERITPLHRAGASIQQGRGKGVKIGCGDGRYARRIGTAPPTRAGGNVGRGALYWPVQWPADANAPCHPSFLCPASRFSLDVNRRTVLCPLTSVRSALLWNIRDEREIAAVTV